MKRSTSKEFALGKNSNTEELSKPRRRFNIGLMVSCVIITLFTVIALVHPLQQILVSGIFLLFAYIVFLVVIGAFIIVLSRHSKHGKKTTVLICGFMLTIYLLGVGATALYICVPNPLFRSVALLLPTITVVFAMVSTFTSFRNRTRTDCFLLLSFVTFLSILLVMIAPPSLSLTLPYIYTPPALNCANLRVYKECLNLLKEHGEYHNFRLNRSKWISLGSNFEPVTYYDTDKYFSNKEIMKIRELRDELYTVKCFQIQRNNDFVLFYKDANYILPVGPGVVYSLNGENPNEADTDVLMAAKPFIKIADDWYMSRELMLRGPRTDVQAYAPKSLIDCSLRTTGLSSGRGLGDKP